MTFKGFRMKKAPAESDELDALFVGGETRSGPCRPWHQMHRGSNRKVAKCTDVRCMGACRMLDLGKKI